VPNGGWPIFAVFACPPQEGKGGFFFFRCLRLYESLYY